MVTRDAPSERTLFIHTPGGPRHPGRVDPAQPTTGPSFYFGPWGAYAEVSKSLAAVAAGRAPDWLRDAPGNHVAHAALLRALHFGWSTNPPKRQFRRDEAEGTMLVVHDFVQVRRMVAVSAFVRSGRQIEFFTNFEFRSRMQDAYFGSVARTGDDAARDGRPEPLTPAETLERLELAGDKEQMEQWAVADRSATGIGTVVPHQKKWLRVGTLLGYRMPGELNWQIAVLRRLGRTPGGRRQAGLELLRGLPTPINVKRLAADETPPPVNAQSLSDFGDGILLTSGSDCTVLLDTVDVAVDNRLLLVGAELRSLVKVSEIVDQLPGVTLLRYTPVAA